MKQPPFEHLVERQEELDLPYDKPLAYVDLSMADGSVKREGPFSKWVADMMVGSGMFFSPDIKGLVIRVQQEFPAFVGAD